MTPNQLWKVSLVTTPEGEEPLAEALQQIFGQPPSSSTPFGKPKATVSIYHDRAPSQWADKRRRFNARVAKLREAGFNVGSPRLRLTRVPRQNWAASWKKHFKPIEIGAALLIKPSWSRRRARRGQAVLRLDPGLSFGTGQHPTTAFCLTELVRCRERGRAQSFLDIGTGSGILALAAARLGYHPVCGFDSDAQAVRIAQRNAGRNYLAHQVRFLVQDLTRRGPQMGRNYSVACANLTADLLLSQRRAILGRLKSGGVLILAGILRSEFETVRNAYTGAGWRMITSRTSKEWRSASFHRSSKPPAAPGATRRRPDRRGA